MSRKDLHFRLRLPAEIKAQVQLAAAMNRRSMTAEIVTRLERSFNDEDIRVLLDDTTIGRSRDLLQAMPKRGSSFPAAAGKALPE